MKPLSGSQQIRKPHSPGILPNVGAKSKSLAAMQMNQALKEIPLGAMDLSKIRQSD